MSFLNTGQCEIITTEHKSVAGLQSDNPLRDCLSIVSIARSLYYVYPDTYTYAGGDHRQKPNMYFITIGLGLTNGYAQIILPMPLPMKARL